MIEPKFSPNAIIVLEKRYLLPGETPRDMLWRVADGNEEYYEMMANLDFLPNSPTLFNAGTGKGTLSACFKFDVPDSLEGIMDVARKAALVQKWGGGVGYALSEIRAKGTMVAGTGRQACGPVAVMRHIYHPLATIFQQGGKRPGAQMGILHCDHPDIREFIHCKDENPDDLSTFNISVALTDKFMEIALGDPGSSQGALWDEICESAWKTGDPGCYFIDAAERGNPTPHLGKLTGTNPCGEVPLLDNEACNLGSINLGNHVSNGKVDYGKLMVTTRTATRFLDDILNQNWFPVAAIDSAVGQTRKLGLGVMGWADMLAALAIPYDSVEAAGLGGNIMREIQAVADDESTTIGLSKGPYPAAKAGVVLRNATRT